jgi:signal transduction histidine kinase
MATFWARIFPRYSPAAALAAKLDALSLRGRILVLCWASIGVAGAVALALSILVQMAKGEERQLRELGWAYDTVNVMENELTSLTRDMYRLAANPTPEHAIETQDNLEDFRGAVTRAEPLLGQPRYGEAARLIRTGLADYQTVLNELTSQAHSQDPAHVRRDTESITRIDDLVDDAVDEISDSAEAEQQALFAQLDGDENVELITTAAAVLGAALLMFALSLAIGRSIRASVSAIQSALSALARGERDIESPNAQRNDEIGDLEKAVQAFRHALMEGDQLRAGAELAAAELEQERASLERRVLERTIELQEATRRAEEANAAKSGFIANMSHELRTPLNAIIGYSEIMRETALEESRTGDLDDHDRVLRAAQNLLKMINEVLDLAKIEAGRGDVEIGPLDVPAIVRGALDAVRPQAELNGDALVVELDPAGFGAAHSDAFKLQQCLINLLANATKFTKQGLITVRAKREADLLIFEVRDTGIGIAADRIEEMFQPFVQADASKTRNVDGTGLGLAITRKLAQLLGGDIGAESEPSRGSIFRLTVAANLGCNAEIVVSAPMSAATARAGM